MFLRLAPLLFLLLLAIAVAPARALAQEGGGHDDGHEVTTQGTEAGQTRDLVPVVLWTTVATLAAAVVGGVLYLFKRRIGAFPAHPDWVAPISVMPSRDFPDEGTFGAAAEAHHGGGHGHH